MKRRLTPILTISVALILIGGLAYAADRRKQAKQVGHPAEPTHEEEALRAELLDAVEGNEKKSTDADDSLKILASKIDKKAESSKPGK